MDEKLEEILKRLDRIETKLDDISDMLDTLEVEEEEVPEDLSE